MSEVTKPWTAAELVARHAEEGYEDLTEIVAEIKANGCGLGNYIDEAYNVDGFNEEAEIELRSAFAKSNGW